MKTSLKNKTVFFALTLITLSFLAACSKESDNNNTAPTVTYTWQGGYCYNNSNQMVANQYCSQSTNSGYYWSNNTCYNTMNQPVNPGYCSTQNGQPGQPGFQQCYGNYYYYSQYGTQQITCNGSNCSGYQLYNSQTNQQVNCQ